MSPNALITLLVLAGAFSLAAVRWERGFVMSLPFLVALNGITLPVAGVSLHVDQLAACALAVPLTASALIGARRIRLDATSWFLAAILIVNVVASVLNSPARSYSLLQCANLASAWVIYVLLFNFLKRREDLDAFLERALWAAVAACVVAVAAFALALTGLTIGGAEVSTSAARRLTAAYGAYGTMVEPNILGNFAGAYLVLAIVLLATTIESSAGPSRRLLRWVVGTTSVALVLTFTRGAWLGALVALVFAAFRVRGFATLGRMQLRRVAAPLVAVIALVIVLLLLPGDAGTLFRFKLANLLNVASQTAIVRVVSYAVALQQALDHLIIGCGTFTFAPLVAQGNDFQQFTDWRNLWIGNYVILALHDTGVVGLGLWLAMLGNLFRNGLRSGVADQTTLALTIAFVSVLVSFLATSGFSLGYSWLMIGMLGARLRLTADERQVATVPAESSLVDPEPSPV